MNYFTLVHIKHHDDGRIEIKMKSTEVKGGRESHGTHLVGDKAIAGEVGILLVVIEACLDHPLVAQGREPACLIEQFVDKLVRAVWLQLQVFGLAGGKVERREELT